MKRKAKLEYEEARETRSAGGTFRMPASSDLLDSPGKIPAAHDWPVSEIACVAVGAVAATLTLVMGGSAATVLGVGLVVVVPLLFFLIRSASRRRLARLRLHRQCTEEVESWRDRWQALQQEAQQTTSALSLMRDGVIMLSSSLQITLINPAARRLLNLDSDQDLYRRPFGEVVRIPELSRSVAAALSGDGTQKLLVEVAQNDVIRPVKVRVDRFNTSGESSLLMALRDETEAHRVEEMRREFIANISHELKTPLAAIKGYAETVELAIGDDTDAALRFMKQIHTQCLRLERLIADMMQLARAQAGRSQWKMTNVSMSEVIHEALESYLVVAEAKSIRLVIDPCDPAATVRADAEATLTIASNLIGNAIHYTPSGGKVRVSCRPAGRFWALVVEDTGVGIPKNEQKRIFERFYRVDKSRETADGGTGIGLSIVKNLTMTLGGEVRVSSCPGEGAKFEVLLPRGK